MSYHIWMIEKWLKFESEFQRSGLRVRYEKDVHPEVKAVCKDFIRYLRKAYYFPQRVNLYVKSRRKIRAEDGDLAFGTFFWTYAHRDEPYIRVATGYYLKDKERYGAVTALRYVLETIAHELTHYFQWVNGFEMTIKGRER